MTIVLESLLFIVVRWTRCEPDGRRGRDSTPEKSLNFRMVRDRPSARPWPAKFHFRQIELH